MWRNAWAEAAVVVVGVIQAAHILAATMYAPG